MSEISEKSQAYLCWLKERGEFNFFSHIRPSKEIVQQIVEKPIPSTHPTPFLSASADTNKFSAKKFPVLVIGDGPSAQIENLEDLLPIKEKQILLNLLNSIGLKRKDFLVINISENLGDHNRTRQQQEKLFLNQIRSFDPKIILSLGQKAGSIFFGEATFKIKDHHGIIKKIYFGEKSIPVLPIFHPRTLVAAPALKKAVWQDVQILIDFLKSNNAQQKI
ncbi:MAG: hypothetical protein KBD78_00635 [Oligoflexales bacterium]|nr:hypothetical protein [Oligoflexales bacterium]